MEEENLGKELGGSHLTSAASDPVWSSSLTDTWGEKQTERFQSFIKIIPDNNYTAIFIKNVYYIKNGKLLKMCECVYTYKTVLKYTCLGKGIQV